MTARPPDPVAELLDELAGRGIQLQADGDRLRYRPVSAMPTELLKRLRASKTQILATLSTACGTGTRLPQPFRFTDGLLDFGDIPVGWLPCRWADELRRKAKRCEENRPDISDYYRAWATDIERRLKGHQGGVSHGGPSSSGVAGI